MAKKPLPDQELLRKLLDYDPETGVLTWRERPVEMFTDGKRWKAGANCKRWNTQFAGKVAFSTKNNQGHLHGTIFGIHYLAHRIIWKWMTGEDPNFVDHISGVKHDNSWVNLRDVTHFENMKNAKRRSDNVSGVTGVFWSSRKKRWRAEIMVNGKSIYLGVFHSIQDAISARNAASKNYGFHKNHGRSTS